MRGTRQLAPPKTEHARRRIALDEGTLAIFRAHRIAQASIRVPEHDRDFVFATRDGQPLHARNVLHAYHEALERAGLPRRSFHQLRHAYATLLLESGEELASISKVLGRSTFATTVDFYGHPTPGVSRRAADKMGKILWGWGEPTRHVAFAFGGRIVTVVPAPHDRNRGRVLVALLPEPGPDRPPEPIALLRVEGDPASPRLSPLALEER